MAEPPPEWSPEEIADHQRIRMVVISDIHATESGVPLTNVAESTESDPTQNALTAACDLMKQVAADADCIICPGDLVNEGQTKPMGWVWRKVQELSLAIDAPLIATVGNHDVALRATGAQRPNSALRDLDPFFPYPDQMCVDTYWAHDFAVVSQAGIGGVLTVNPSAQLGFYDESEREHGCLGRHRMRELPKRLDDIGAGKPINVCVVHHQP